MKANKLKKCIKGLDRTITGIENFFMGLLACLLLIIVLLVCYSVISRLFSLNSFWVVEISQYSLVYLTFLAAPWILREDAHVNIDLVLDKVSPKTREVMVTISLAITLVICIVLFYFSLLTTIDNFNRNVKLPDTFGLSKFIILAAIPLSSFFLALRCLRKLFQKLTVKLI